jgi:[lysine-biosynthesis-protein LysW]--L-2-aminoadipate ligase
MYMPIRDSDGTGTTNRDNPRGSSISILYDILRIEEKLLINEFKALGVEVRLVNINDMSLNLNDYEEGFGIVLIRALSHSKAGLVARILNMRGITTINNGMAIENSWNKAIALSILARSKVPVVPTKLVLSINLQGDGINYPAIVKPVHGSWGRLVSLVGSSDELSLLLKHRALGDSYSRVAMVQPFIGDGTDYRVFVIGGEVVASMMRKPSNGDWRSNVSRGGTAHGVRLGDDAYEIAVKATEVLGLDYAGVDLLYSPGRGYLVNEVNAIPEFKGLMGASGVNIPRKIVEYVLSVARR